MMLNGFYFKNNHYVIALKDVLKFRLLPVRIVGTCQVEGLDGAWSQYWNHDCRLRGISDVLGKTSNGTFFVGDGGLVSW